jgi:hypothetical protein
MPDHDFDKLVHDIYRPIRLNHRNLSLSDVTAAETT